MPRSTRHDILPSMRALLAVALTGLSGLACGSTPRPAPLAAPAVPAAPALAAPPAIDPGARGAPYLTAVARELQPRWADTCAAHAYSFLRQLDELDELRNRVHAEKR